MNIYVFVIENLRPPDFMFEKSTDQTCNLGFYFIPKII